MTIDIRELEEFRFTYGDPRLNILKFLVSLPNYGTYVDVDNIKTKDLFRLVCNKINARQLVYPTTKKWVKYLRNDDNPPIVVLPVVITSKYRCAAKNRQKHGLVFLYNRITHQLERIDIKRYHLEGFNVKSLVNKTINFLVPELKDIDSKAKYFHEVDVDNDVVKKLGLSNPIDSYPILMISYLLTKSKFPELSSTSVYTKTNEIKARCLRI